MQISFVGFQPVQSSEHMAVCITCLLNHFIIAMDARLVDRKDHVVICLGLCLGFACVFLYF